MRPSHKLSLVLAGALLAGAPIARGESSRDALWRDVSEQRTRLREFEEKLLTPDFRDSTTFAAFLEQPDTGLVRLLPREAGEKVLSIRGGAAYYCFSARTREYGFGSDIELMNDVLSSGFAGADFGFFEDAGNISLEGMTRNHPAASPLASLVIPTSLGGAREMQNLAERKSAARSGGRPSEVKVKGSVGRTYFLRSVNYGASDVLVAFRIVRLDDDGSVTLLWKILERFPTPELKKTPEPKN